MTDTEKLEAIRAVLSKLYEATDYLELGSSDQMEKALQEIDEILDPEEVGK